ncbi:MAG TPA: DUF6115 domain-containing protein [Mobilitalea sp.]|nr:DUF6115 domain-containing protein [Mobilitalea sp.]
MNPLEIVLIILGIVIIIISCMLVDNSKNSSAVTLPRSFAIEQGFSEDDVKQMKDKMNELMSEISEETVVRTDDSLSKISNEKIIAVSEFSDQVLEKIKRNHEEVVFLYNMLNDKEKELKSAVKEIDSSKKKVQDIIESKKEIEKTQTAKKTAAEKNAPTQAQSLMPAKEEKQPKDEVAEAIQINSLNSNNNTQILSLYSQGKSVVEISKLLGLGQGEVKLVIELFRGKK